VIKTGDQQSSGKFEEQEWARDTPRKKISTPYNFAEKMSWLKNHIIGPSKKFKKLTDFLPQSTEVNPITPKLKLGFLGDIMPMKEKQLQISTEVVEFFKDVDYLIGNFEGTITEKENEVFMSQRHSEEIIENLKGLCPPERFVLGCANNHAGDFGWTQFNRSYEILREAGFLTTGRRDEPTVLLNDQVSITACTNWTNQPNTPYIIYLDEIDELYNAEAEFNILYPHWGYEIQLYPSPKQIEFAKALLDKWDMIIGHHSHCPQPITSYMLNGASQVVAYSLGDFTIAIDIKKYHWGMIAKVELGPGEEKWQVGKLEWKFVHGQKVNDNLFEVQLEDSCKYFKDKL
jgi:poly-gamma-glutamate capsule biosynthesis protein CapA/YwtB (metallophosphatase superfamily)